MTFSHQKGRPLASVSKGARTLTCTSVFPSVFIQIIQSKLHLALGVWGKADSSLKSCGVELLTESGETGHPWDTSHEVQSCVPPSSERHG